MSLVGAGAAAALSAEPVIAAVSRAKIKAIAFDGLAVSHSATNPVTSDE